MRYLIIFALSLLASACMSDPSTVDPVQLPQFSYLNFHELVRDQVKEELKAKNAPADTANNLAECWADAKTGRLEASEIAQMDKFAQGEIALSRAELDRIDALTFQRAGTTDQSEFVKPYCPGLSASFKQYL